MINLVKADYHGIAVAFTEYAWINATEVADKHGKRVADWLENTETQNYISALAEILNVPKEALLKTRRGRYGGTWMHPRLAIFFARWLDVRFGVWCDDQVYQILSGIHPHYDRKNQRQGTSVGFKIMEDVLRMKRQQLGKECLPHHFSNEAKLVNFALTGAFEKIDRDGLSSGDLDLLAKIEIRNTVLIGSGMSYKDRKLALQQFASEQRAANVPMLEAA